MILESIFRGNLHPTEQICPRDEEYRKLSQDVVALGDQLEQQISPAVRELLETYISRIYSVQLMETEALFTYGFSLGMGLQREVTEQLQNID